MSYIVANAVSILLATCAGLCIGLAYRALPSRPGQLVRRSSIGLIVTAVVAEFWLASILAGALILAPAPVNPWVMSLMTAVVIWIGFVVPTLVVTHVFRGLSNRSIIFDCSHWLVLMVVQAAVLHWVGLVHPT